MNLQKLFEAQAELDAYIEQQHPTQPGENRLEKKVLALLVELGECANEWRGFKFWSNNQEPKTGEEHRCIQCKGDGLVPDFIKFKNNNGNKFKFCHRCGGSGAVKSKNPLLEEYVDVIHFILSIGNDLRVKDFGFWVFDSVKSWTVENYFNYTFSKVVSLADSLQGEKDCIVYGYYSAIRTLLRLGHKLGFTEEEIEQAYWKKYEINKQRQRDGY